MCMQALSAYCVFVLPHLKSFVPFYVHVLIPFSLFFSISNAADSQTWQTMATIKSNILRRIEKEPSGVKLCCIKFIQRVVQVQTPGQVADPRVRDWKYFLYLLSQTEIDCMCSDLTRMRSLSPLYPAIIL